MSRIFTMTSFESTNAIDSGMRVSFIQNVPSTGSGHGPPGGEVILGPDGQPLELPGGVLGMELLHPDPLRAERLDEIAGIVRDGNQPGHAVRGTERRGNEVVSVAC
jgi:hypothetical protein